ncbi:unnamed protein product [Rhizoctonia solani]|uniref:P-type ATPase A domain-containing protein n=1 Tax=Rhizoctonia solani TaxID=456999 RepID=A0A8H3AXA7_9AGAM|nr:unnamed protein product [Rhizoctonia solani]
MVGASVISSTTHITEKHNIFRMTSLGRPFVECVLPISPGHIHFMGMARAALIVIALFNGPGSAPEWLTSSVSFSCFRSARFLVSTKAAQTRSTAAPALPVRQRCLSKATPLNLPGDRRPLNKTVTWANGQVNVPHHLRLANAAGKTGENPTEYWVLTRKEWAPGIQLPKNASPPDSPDVAGQCPHQLDQCGLQPFLSWCLPGPSSSRPRLTEAINVSIDQAALAGKSLPQSMKNGDQCFSGWGSTCKQGEAEGVVISTGGNTFFGCAASLVGQDDDTTGHLQKILAQIGSFCLVFIGLFVLLKIIILYPRCPYFTLTTNKLTIDKELVKTYGPFSPQDTILLVAYASRTKNQNAIDQCVVGNPDGPTPACAGIKLLDFKPFSPVDRRTEITCCEEFPGKFKHVTKGMGEGNRFELIGLLAIFDPPRDDAKQTIDDIIAGD